MSIPVEIQITGNASGAKSELTSILGDLGKTAISADNAGKSFKQMAFELSRFKTGASSTLNPELVSVYSSKIKQLELDMRTLAEAEQQERASVQASAIAHEEMSVAVNNTSKGTASFENSLYRATNPMSIASREINNLSRRLVYMGGAAVFGLVSEGVSMLIPYVIEFAKGLDFTSSKSKELATNLANMASIMEEAAKTEGKEATTAKYLYDATQDVNLSMNERLKAVKDLKKEFPEYFNGISNETILNGNAKNSYDKLTNSIITSARALAALNKIAALETTKFDIQNKLDAAQAEADKKISAAKDGNVRIQGGGQGGLGVTQFFSQAKGVAGAAKDFNKVADDLNKKIDAINAQEQFIQDQIGKSTLETAITDQKFGKGVKTSSTNTEYEAKLEALNKYLEKEREILKDRDHANLEKTEKNSLVVNQELLKLEEDFLKKKEALDIKYHKKTSEDLIALRKAEDAQQLLLDSFKASQVLKDKTSPVNKASSLGYLETSKIDPNSYQTPVFTDNIQKQIDASQILNEKIQTTSAILNKTLGPAFQNLFAGIIDGSHKAFQDFANALKQIVAQIAATIAKAAALAVIMTLIFPPSKSGLSFTSLFKNFLGVPGHASGVGYSPGGVALVGERGPELVNLPRGSSVTPNAQLNASMGGPQVFIPNLTLRGQDMIVAFQRANATALRNG